ncbi:hypothetical protein, partial [Escherichia coli]|uniref:hypothetical protein n=1 Tax=Escherichia coli TaxID=562 RepID=UPI003D7C1F1E
EPATTTFRINAPAKPATIELTPGYFQITAVPRLAVYDPTVQFSLMVTLLSVPVFAVIAPLISAFLAVSFPSGVRENAGGVPD